MVFHDKKEVIKVLDGLAKERIIEYEGYLFNRKADYIDIRDKNYLIIKPYGWQCNDTKAEIIANQLEKFGFDAIANRGDIKVFYNKESNLEEEDKFDNKVHIKLKKIIGGK